MDEAQAENKIVVNLPQEKIDKSTLINQPLAKEIEYSKNVALCNKNEKERRRLTILAIFRVFFIP